MLVHVLKLLEQSTFTGFDRLQWNVVCLINIKCRCSKHSICVFQHADLHGIQHNCCKSIQCPVMTAVAVVILVYWAGIIFKCVYRCVDRPQIQYTGICCFLVYNTSKQNTLSIIRGLCGSPQSKKTQESSLV